MKHKVATFTIKSKAEITPVIITATSSILIFYKEKKITIFYIDGEKI